MLSAKENFLETIKPDGKPDRLVKQYEGAVFYPPNPAASYIRGNRHPGMDPLIDRFGKGNSKTAIPLAQRSFGKIDLRINGYIVQLGIGRKVKPADRFVVLSSIFKNIINL